MGTNRTRKMKSRNPGPSSRDEVLLRLDRRTVAGRVMRDVINDLTADLGGDVTCAQRLIIQQAAVKSVRMTLLADQLLEGADIATDQHQILAWSNSLRLDLAALGLERRARNITPTHLADHFSRPFTEAAE